MEAYHFKKLKFNSGFQIGLHTTLEVSTIWEVAIVWKQKAAFDEPIVDFQVIFKLGTIQGAPWSSGFCVHLN